MAIKLNRTVSPTLRALGGRRRGAARRTAEVSARSGAPNSSCAGAPELTQMALALVGSPWKVTSMSTAAAPSDAHHLQMQISRVSPPTHEICRGRRAVEGETGAREAGAAASPCGQRM